MAIFQFNHAVSCLHKVAVVNRVFSFIISGVFIEISIKILSKMLVELVGDAIHAEVLVKFEGVPD